MAFADPAHGTPNDELKTLRGEIGQFLFDTFGSEKIKTVGLRESFAIWQLNPEHFMSASRTMPDNPSAFWHYQVYLDGMPRAHSVVEQIDGKSRIHSVEVSGLAERIDRAIDWIDTEDKDRNPVHYLVASCCRVTAFRLVDNDIVYVVGAPPVPNGSPENKRLAPETIVSTTEFLNRLRGLFEAITSSRSSKQSAERIEGTLPQ